MTNRSKTNPDNPGATDYTWSAKDYGHIKAGQLSDGRDVCYIEDLQTLLEPDEAIGLATDLLRWAQFMQEGADLAKKEAEEEDRALDRAIASRNNSLLQRQAE